MLVNFTKHLRKKKKKTILHILPENGKHPNSFYEVSITLILEQDKDVTRKEHQRLISLMNTNSK